jgi:stage III sporulation protein AF
MDGLKTLIRNLAFILLLASFLEMLLPSKSMRGFVQMVMGLFVIAAILNPLADLLNWDFENSVPAWAGSSSGDLPVLAQENSSDGEDNSSTEANAVVIEQYRRILVNQIQALVSGVEGVKSSDTNVELKDGGDGFADYPQIQKVEIHFSQQSVSIEPVKPVIIGGGNIDQAEDQGTAESAKAMEIKKQVASLMQLPEEIVFVQEEK